MSLSNNFPTIKPSLLLDFANVNQLDPRITFTRASTATYTNSNGLLTSSATNTPRFDYNPNTGAPQGLLVEEQRTNLLTYSSEFDNAAWTKFRSNVSANVIASPTGNLDADKLIEDTTASNSHYIVQNPSVVSGSAYTYTVYAKDAGRRYLQLIFTTPAFSVNVVATFDLISGTSTQSGGVASITNAGNGWYRCSVTATAATTTNVNCQLRLSDSSISTPASYTGDGTSGIYIWGAQLEAGAFPTSYVPSTNTFTSRASVGSFVDSTGTLQSAAINVARNTYNPSNLTAAPFLLLEESRTNSIRNSTGVGAIAGTPGTLPTNWVGTGGVANGLTRQIVGVGVESGTTYVDIRYSGTTTAASFHSISEETIGAVAASSGQTWTHSAYISLVGGSTTNINAFDIGVNEYSSAPAYLTGFSVNIAISSGALLTKRYLVTRTLTNASTASIHPFFAFTYSSGVAIDITLRIGLPQLEQGYGASSVIPNSPTFTSRASAATYYNASGLVTSAATNVARLNYNPANLAQPANLILENAATNLITYSSEFDNAAWVKTRSNIAANVIASPTGNVDADKLIEDTSVSNTHIVYAAPAAASNSYTFSVYAKAAERTEIAVRLDCGTSGQQVGFFNLSSGAIGTVTSNIRSSIASAGNGWYRCSISTITNDNIINAVLMPAVGGTQIYTGDGVSGIYIWGAQLETGSAATTYIPSTNTFTSRASTGSYFDSAGVLQSAAINVARNTYNPANLAAAPFLLLEEARTNSIRNNTMVGAVAGTPGTLPTNWVQAAISSGLTQQIVGVGTDSGINYIEIRLSGTTADANGYVLNFELGTQIAAANGQSWAASLYLAIVSGSTANIASIVQRLTERSAAGAFLASTDTTIATATSSLKNRFFATRTFNNVSTAFTTSALVLNIVSGVAIDITLRIGLPQLEQGYGASSVIPTSTVAVTRAADVSSSATTTRAADVYAQAALTRSADVSSSAQTTRAAEAAAVNNLTPWYNQTEGTLFAEGSRIAAGLTSGVMVGFAQTLTFNQSMYMSNDIGNGNSITSRVINGGVIQATLGGPVATGVTNTFKTTLAYATNNFAGSINGATPLTDVSGTVPTPIQVLAIGSAPWSAIGETNWSGYIRRIAYYPKRLSNTELQGITS